MFEGLTDEHKKVKVRMFAVGPRRPTVSTKDGRDLKTPYQVVCLLSCKACKLIT
jgi:hypothetical protein